MPYLYMSIFLKFPEKFKNRSPRVMTVENFLSEEECKELIGTAQSKMAPSTGYFYLCFDDSWDIFCLMKSAKNWKEVQWSAHSKIAPCTGYCNFFLMISGVDLRECKKLIGIAHSKMVTSQILTSPFYSERAGRFCEIVSRKFTNF